MTNVLPRTAEAVSSTYNPSLPNDTDSKRTQSPITNNPPEHEIETLKKELDNRDSTITELKNQLKNLQTIVEQLTKENSVLKTNSIDDDQSMTSQTSISESGEKFPERGRSLETDQLTLSEEVEVRQSAKMRPVSMYEAREGPKNNWQVTKHQVLIHNNFTNI